MLALMSFEIADRFQNLTNIISLPLMPYDKLDPPVASHADMLICVIDKAVFCYEDYYKAHKPIFEEIEKLGYTVVTTSAKCKSKYPKDISLNVFVACKKIFCKKEYVAKEILEYARINGYEIINVKQGYTACSCLRLKDNVVVTGDMGMKRVLEENGFEVFSFDNSKIFLNGYNCGFIGGSAGVLDNKIYFFGPREIFEENEELKSFLNEENFQLVSILNDRVYDFGGIKFLKQ